jgi:eukaryotic-like serine/threonine-protein kinase
MDVFPSPQTSASDARGFIQRRVANLGLVLACIGLAFVVMRVIAVLVVGQPERLVSTSLLTHYLGVAASTAMWLGCRWGDRSRATIYMIELIGLVATCSLYTVMAAGIPQAFRPEMTILLAFGVFLLAHAVHVPSSWSWTALLGTAMAVPLIVGAWMILTPMDPRIVAASASAAGSVQTTEGSIIGIGMASVVTWWAVIVSTAAAASAVIYGLRREVRQALRLGQYTLEEKLGEGGMGTVYRGLHALLRRHAAIKLINTERVGEGSQRAKAIQRFEREAHVTANLKSPHTVQLYDFGISAEGAFYYVMELLDGVDLETVVEKYGPLRPERVVFLLRQVCESLEEAHTAGLVHRDIKPANIFLCRHGICFDFVKVLDFGLVALGPQPEQIDPKLTADGFTGGTPAYLAPEMVASADTVDGRTDVYAIGCVAYWLLSGHAPFERKTPMATILAHVNDQPTPPSSVSEIAIPEQLEALVLECLEKKPTDRPASAAELSRRLDAVVVEDGWDQERAAHWWETHKPTHQEANSSSSHEAAVTITRAFL